MAIRGIDLEQPVETDSGGLFARQRMVCRLKQENRAAAPGARAHAASRQSPD